MQGISADQLWGTTGPVMSWDTALSFTVTAHLGSTPLTTAYSWAASLELEVSGRQAHCSIDCKQASTS